MIRYDRQDNKVNALNFDVGTEMNTLLERLEASPTVRASVLLSGESPDEVVAWPYCVWPYHVIVVAIFSVVVI